MIEGIDRLVDLVGPRTSGLTGATPDQLVDAIARCDTSALAATDGHFAAAARDGRTVRLARTIGLPLRYFVAKMSHGPFLVVSDRIDRIFDWCQTQRIGWQFDPVYTRMVPAHHVVELDQVGCPDPTPRYQRFFNPPAGQGSADLDRAGADYMGSACAALKEWVRRLPPDAPLAVAFSGGVDSTAVLLLARRAFEDLGRDPARVRAFTLDFGGGQDAAQAEAVVRTLGIEDSWERIVVSDRSYDLVEAIRTIEDYHPLDVECAAASLGLLRAIRQRHPALRYLVDGDGGDENLKSYPLGDSDLTLSSVLRNPLLYQEGWGVDAIKHSEVFSGGLSRAYVRTCAPAAACGFEAFSPLTVRSVIESAVAIPFAALVDRDVERLYTVKPAVVHAGIRAVLGLDMPVSPKRRFQDGAAAVARPRVSKAWCRQVFNRLWDERLRDTPAFAAAAAGKPDALDERRSGNEMTV